MCRSLFRRLQIRSLSCRDQFLATAFAQLTYRESLRDIETCMRSFSGKFYDMGFRSTIARSTLGDANESRDWRIYADFAQTLIAIARPLYAHDPIGVELNQSLYALDSTTIDLCLSLFPWAKFRQHKAAVKMHTHAGLAWQYPHVYSHHGPQNQRREYSRRVHSGSGVFLCNGSRIRRFRTPLRVHPLLRLLRRAHKRKCPAPAAVTFTQWTRPLASVRIIPSS
jgi:hypothetical protein